MTMTRHSKRLVDLDHVKYVKTQPCFIRRAGFHGCQGPIQAHHLLKPGDKKRGMSLKAGDNWCIPLCMHHHHLLHTKYGDEHKFFKRYGIPEDGGIKYAMDLYNKTNLYRDSDDDLPF